MTKFRSLLSRRLLWALVQGALLPSLCLYFGVDLLSPLAWCNTMFDSDDFGKTDAPRPEEAPKDPTPSALDPAPVKVLRTPTPLEELIMEIICYIL